MKIIELLLESAASLLQKSFYAKNENDMVNVDLEISGENLISINYIQSRVEQNGHGSRSMQLVCELADKLGVTLELEVYPQGSMSHKELINFYKKFGFSPESNQPSRWMVREPK